MSQKDSLFNIQKFNIQKFTNIYVIYRRINGDMTSVQFLIMSDPPKQLKPLELWCHT